MTSATFSTSTEAQQAASLLEGYSFELGDHDARQWVSLWLEFYRPAWIRDAVVEALYQGRYKSVSVRQILELWSRRGQPVRHVTHEFEAAVCREFGEVKLVAAPKKQARPTSIRRSTRQTYRPQQGSVRSAIQQAGQAPAFGRAAAVSFDLSATDLSATPPGMAPVETRDLAQSEAEKTPSAEAISQSSQQTNETASVENRAADSPVAMPYRDLNNGNESYRRMSRSAIQSPAETEALLRTQQSQNGVLYTSARAIQPFKPALPFSAQTLPLARQKALV